VKAIVAGAPAGCFAPLAEDPLWGDFTPGELGTQAALVRSTQAELGNQCQPELDHANGDRSNDLLAAHLRAKGKCASRLADSTTVQSSSDPRKWEEYHASSPYDTGCWSNNPAHYPKGVWIFNGPLPTPPAACSVPVPTVDEILCKLHHVHNNIYDCTPKAHGQPILPEGHPERWACELEAMGGAAPVYLVQTTTGALELSYVDNPMQFKITGAGQGVVTCTVPAVSQALCNTAVSR